MKRWYVIQVYTGFEDVVKLDLERRIEESDLQDLFGEVLLPTGHFSAFFSTEEEKKKEKIFPGYLLVQMEMTGESFRLVSTIHRVARFLGGERPVSLSNKEVERIFAQVSGELPVFTEKQLFVVGGEVNITNGPFSGFVGVIDKVDEDREKLTVMVSIFGRLTPVELGFDQVKR